MYTALFRKPPPILFLRERISTHDNDFLDLDFVRVGGKKVVVLCHGLEGSSDSKYMRGTGSLLSKNGFDVCAMNYRFCSGEINRTPQLYHSGWTIDLHTVVDFLQDQYDEIYLVGFSLGGNLVLKYAGEPVFTKSDKIKGVCAVSVPLNLLSSSLQMQKFENTLYTKRFLKTLIHKVKLKNQRFPDHFDLSHITKVKTVLDFDDYYTGPLNGFEDARDYYSKCSSDQFLTEIEIDTLIINALDDPFLGEQCFPSAEEIKNDKVITHYTKYGGHVGFFQRGDYCWDEEMILEFFTSL